MENTTVTTEEGGAVNDEHLIRLKDALSVQLAESSAFAKTILALAIAVISASALAFKIMSTMLGDYVYIIQISYGLLLLSILFAIVTILFILTSTTKFVIHLSERRTKNEIIEETQRLISRIKWLNITTSTWFICGLLTFTTYILLANKMM